MELIDLGVSRRNSGYSVVGLNRKTLYWGKHKFTMPRRFSSGSWFVLSPVSHDPLCIWIFREDV